MIQIGTRRGDTSHARYEGHGGCLRWGRSALMMGLISVLFSLAVGTALGQTFRAIASDFPLIYESQRVEDRLKTGSFVAGQ